MVNSVVFIVWLIVGTVSFVGFLFLLVMFGRLMKLQVKIWLLSKRGFHLVEHIGTNRVRTYYYLRPKDNKFVFRDGFYLDQKDTTTKTSALLPGIPGGWNFRKLDGVNDDFEADKLRNTINKMNYDYNAVTLRWGIPIITYVGNSPHPVNFKEPDKVYGAQVIRDVYIRLLATSQYGDLRRMIMFGILAMAGVAIGLFLLYLGFRNSGDMANNCVNMWNATQNSLLRCVNDTAILLARNSSVII
jgi:hypothetical protein